ncbi:MAG: glycoside hydrolase family 9 protein [Acidimicrobiales bacterium]
MVSRRSVGFTGGIIILLVCGLMAGLAGWSLFQWWRHGRTTDNALRRETVPALVTPAPVASGPVRMVQDQPSPDGVFTVEVAAPDNAQAIRIDQNPDFVGAEWQEIAPLVEVESDHSGHQMFFSQFLLADGSLSDVAVVAGVVDPGYEAAISSETGPHQPSWVRPFSPTELAIRIEAGRLERGALESYDFDDPPDGDDVSRNRGRLVVERDGEIYGLQVSKRRDAIRRPDRLIGRPLAIDDVVEGRWSITSTDDRRYADGLAPTAIEYLASPGGSGIDSDLESVREVVYDIAVTLPAPLQPGASYRLLPPVELTESVLHYEPERTISPAVRVNQIGFAAGDEPKLGYLSGWFDGIGNSATEVDPEPMFLVIDVDTGDVAERGTGQPKPVVDEMGRGDLTGAPVVVLDFSTLTRPGRYQLCVDGIGCSYEFSIDDRVWHNMTTAVARAAYHQRSGVELGPPYTAFSRPRPYHPEDGATVTASDYSLLQAQTDTSNTSFTTSAERGTAELVEEAWGGHFDAGDWDRRINHLWYARNAAQLVIRFPETFEQMEMNIPESGDAVPDLLDEALWSLDLYRRMQLENGAVRGGIEASEHPPADATSWTDDLAVFAYRPDAFSSYLYAGIGAEMAVALRPYDTDRADELLASALSAMNWAESASVEAGGEERVAEQRNVAAAALLLATGDPDWHDVFVRTATFLEDEDPLLSCHAHNRCDAAWIYLQVDESLTHEAIRAELRTRFITTADTIMAAADGTAYGWTTENPFVPLIWGLGRAGAPHASGLLKAFHLTGDSRYRAAAVRSAGAALGANPMNRVLLTGLGTEPVRNPLINDVKFGGIPVWAGTPVFGSHTLNPEGGDAWIVDDILTPAGAWPNPNELPYLWQWYDVDSVAQFNEFTIHQSHSEALLTFGTLAATATSTAPASNSTASTPSSTTTPGSG